MKILVTGASGFIGKNLVSELENRGSGKILELGRETSHDLLDNYCREANFVFHLAGVNRPRKQDDYKGNVSLTSALLDKLGKHKNTCPVMFSSSTQALLDNPYGKSKKACEDLLFQYSKVSGARVLVYRFPNVFGKWCRPNYNSAVATFCHNIARGLPIKVRDPSASMNLLYIDDLVEELINALGGKENRAKKFCEVPQVHIASLGEVVDLLYSFKNSRVELTIPNMTLPLTKKLYSTYLSYLPEDGFVYELRMNIDDRGSFTEFIRTLDRGQVSINISKPGITKGNHWHHSKNEKFLVISGTGLIRFRRISSDEIIEYPVGEDKLMVVDIPPGYTHHIENTGTKDMVTVMWANEPYDPRKPDTYPLEV